MSTTGSGGSNLLSFLTQSPMQYAPSTQQTSTAMPSWYNDYTQGILQNAAQFANQGYQQYQGPQVAPLSADQLASYQTVQNAQGMGVAPAQQGQAAVTSAMQGPTPLQAASPYLGAAQQGINSSLQSPNALQASSPYLNEANAPLSQTMQQFMNPYTSQVANASNQLSAQNFNQNVLPALQSQFTQAGQVLGSTQQGQLAEQLGAAENLNERMATASTLASGWNSALGGAESQAGIQAGLGSTAANAANAAQGTGLYGAGLTAGLGSTAGGLQNQGVQNQFTGASTLGNLGTVAQTNALNQATLQNEMGQQQQAQTQANYNVPLQQFNAQTQWPLTAASAMQGALSGIQVPTSTTNYQYSPYGTSASPLQQGVGLASTGASLANLLTGNNATASQGSSSLPWNISTATGGHIKMAKGGTLHLKRKSPLQMAGGGQSYLPGFRPLSGVIPFGVRAAPYPAAQGGMIRG